LLVAVDHNFVVLQVVRHLLLVVDDFHVIVQRNLGRQRAINYLLKELKEEDLLHRLIHGKIEGEADHGAGHQQLSGQPVFGSILAGAAQILDFSR